MEFVTSKRFQKPKIREFLIQKVIFVENFGYYVYSFKRFFMFKTYHCFIHFIVVLLPFINFLTDPDYINQKILEYMEKFVQNHNLHQSSCTHAESFQEFIQLIRTNDDVNHLKHVR